MKKLTFELEQFRQPSNHWSDRDDFSELFQQVGELLKKAESITPIAGTYSADVSSIYGLSLWFRVLENCRAGIAQADMGLFGAAAVSARAALECLFHACALWKHPDLIEIWKNKQRSESIKQADGIAKESKKIPGGLHDDHEDFIEDLRSLPKPTKLLGAQDAADKAGLMSLYEYFYRGCSAYAHASVQSAHGHVCEENEVIVLSRQSDTKVLLVAMLSLKQCLKAGTSQIADRLNDPSFLKAIRK